jgi:signal transduction histidine kinase
MPASNFAPISAAPIGAATVSAPLRAQDDSLVLRVRDNGRGITRGQIEDPQSLGLVEMRELALSFGGKISLDGIPGKGTTVSVEIPFDAQVARANAGGNPAA